jgi:hypothetical protein
MDNNIYDSIAAQLSSSDKESKLRASLGNALDVDPEAAAKAGVMARQAGVPTVVAETLPDEVKRRIKQESSGLGSMFKNYPVTAKSLSDPEFAKIAHDDIPNLQKLEQSVGGLSTTSSTLEETTAMLEKQGAYMALLFGAYGLGDADDLSAFAAQRSMRMQDVRSRLPLYARKFEEDYANADGLLEGAAVLATNPRALGRTVVTQAPNSILPLTLGFAGAGLGSSVAPGPGSLAGFLGGGFTGSVMTEIGAWMDGELSKRGVDMTDPAQIKAALADQTLMAEVRAQAERKGLATAAVDTAFNLFGAKFLKVKPGAGAGARAGNVAAEIGVQSVGEGVGEAAGQLAATGEVDGKDALLEAVAGFGQSVGDTAISQSIKAGEQGYTAASNAFNGKALAEQKRTEIKTMMAAAKGSQAIARDPVAVREKIEEGNPGKKVFIEAEQAVTFMQSLDEEKTAWLAQMMPELAQELNAAAISGTDVSMNQSDFIAYVAPLEGAESLTDFIKYDAADIPADVLAGLDDEGVSLTPEELDEAGDGGQGMTDGEQYERAIYDQLLATGKYTPDAARTSAKLGRKYYETMSDRLGDDAEAQRLLKARLDGLGVSSPMPESVTSRYDGSDLFINQARDFFGKSAGTKKKSRTPLINYLINEGGVRRGSPLAAELTYAGIDPKTYPRLYRKDGKLTDADNLPANEFNSTFSDFNVQAAEDSRGYVDRDWLIGQMRDEVGGNYYRTMDEKTKEDQEAAYEDLRNVLFNMDIDLQSANNADIKKVLERVREDGDTLNQSDSNAAAEGLRSALLDAATNLKQAKGSGDQMLGILQNTAGVKAEEIAWTGLDEFLKGKKAVTKDEVIQYLEQNQVQVQDVVLGDQSASKRITKDTAAQRIENGQKVLWFRFDDETAVQIDSLDSLGADSFYAQQVDAGLAEWRNGGTNIEGRPAGDTKFQKYTLPGGENYREVLMTLPNMAKTGKFRVVIGDARIRGQVFDTREEAEAFVNEKAGGVQSILDSVKIEEDWEPNANFQSTHFDQPNIIAHVRLNDRTDADGKRVLFVEEIQSDWHQAGRKKGYTQEKERRMSSLTEQRDAMPEGAERDAVQAQINEIGQEDYGVPDAPFKKTWHEMAFRRVAQMAAQQGYDAIAWTPGEVQNERFDLSKQIQSFQYEAIFDEQGNKTGLYEIAAYDLNGDKIVDEEEVNLDRIEELAGKDIAQKVQEEQGRSMATERPMRPNWMSIEGDGLKLGGDGMKGFYDKIVPTYAKKFGKKFGAEVKDARLTTDKVANDGSLASQTAFGLHTVHSMDITDTMRDAAQKGFELFQSMDGGNRGSITFTRDGRSLVELAQDADLSTFLHEMGHFFWKVQSDIAKLPGAETRFPEIYKDVQAVRDWVGAEGGATLSVEQEEKIARGFEAYLFEGKAPSVDLENAFRSFKAWLLRIYRSLKSLNVTINNDIREVFDRMLATDAEIELMKLTDNFAASDEVLKLLNKTERDAYLKKQQKAADAAKDKLLRDALKQVRREENSYWKDEYERVKAEQTSIVETAPLQRAVQYMRKEQKLDRKSFERVYGKTTASNMPRGIFGVDGAPLEVIAELFGYRSPNELVTELGAFVEPGVEIERLAVEEMKSRYGDMLTDGTIERAAVEKYHNEIRAQALDMEYRKVAEMLGVKPLPREAFEAQARRMIGENKLDFAENATRFYKAEVKAAREFGKALKGKDYENAAKWKRQQILNHYLYREARDFKTAMDKAFTKWGKLNKKDAKLPKGLDIDYVNAARQILSRYGIGRSTFDMSSWYNQLAMDDPERAAELMLAIDMNTGQAKKWRDMTGDEFIGLRDAIANLLQVGRNAKEITIDGQKVELAAVHTDLLAQLQTIKPVQIENGYNAKVGAADKRKISFMGMRAMGRRVELWVKNVDNGNTGPFRKFVFNPIKDAALKYREQRAVYVEKMAAILKPHAERLRDGGTIHARELNYTFEDRGELIGMLLHTGNDGNKDKLLRGYKWDEAAFNSFVDRITAEGVLTKEDFDLVQSLWDLAGELKQPSWKVHRELYGYYPEEVTAMPFMTPFGEYKGGYWPAVADSMKVEDQAIRQEQGAVTQTNNSFMFPTTGRGQLKGRTNYAAPLEFSLRLLPGHIDKQLRFIHMEPVVKDVAKIFSNKEFRENLRQWDPNIAKDAIIPWLQRSAQQTVEYRMKGDAGQFMDAGFKWMRRNTGAQIMMGNVLNALQQVTGIAPAMREVGARNFARSFAKFMGNPAGYTKAVWDTSAEMRFRQTLVSEDAQQIVNDVISGKSKLKNVADAAQKHGYIFQRIMDTVVAVPAWMAAYDKGVAEGMSDADALRYADGVVRTTQGSTAPEDVSRIEAGYPGVRLFTMFYSYFNTQANLIGTDAQINQRKGGGVAAMTGRQFYLYLMVFAVPALASAMIVQGLRGGLPDDEDEDGSVLDDWMAWFLYEQARSAMATVPGLGQVGVAALNAWNDKPFDDRISTAPVISMGETLARTPYSVANALLGDGDKSKAVKDTLATAGFLTGLPLGQLGKPLGYITDIAEGDTEPENPADVAAGLVAGSPVR